jgi:hypothetical protein
VRLGGIDIYLGKHDSDESRAVYDRLIGEWVPQGRQAPGTPGSQTTLTVSRLVKIVGRQCGIYELTKKEAGLVLNQLTNSQPSLQPA